VWESEAVAGNRAVSDECCTGNRVESVLSAQQRRVVCALLDERSRPADPILCEGETLDCEEHLTVCYELHHVLFPSCRRVDLSSSTGSKTRYGEDRDSPRCVDFLNRSMTIMTRSLDL